MTISTDFNLWFFFFIQTVCSRWHTLHTVHTISHLVWFNSKTIYCVYVCLFFCSSVFFVLWICVEFVKRCCLICSCWSWRAWNRIGTSSISSGLTFAEKCHNSCGFLFGLKKFYMHLHYRQKDLCSNATFHAKIKYRHFFFMDTGQCS